MCHLARRAECPNHSMKYIFRRKGAVTVATCGTAFHSIHVQVEEERGDYIEPRHDDCGGGGGGKKKSELHGCSRVVGGWVG